MVKTDLLRDFYWRMDTPGEDKIIHFLAKKNTLKRKTLKRHNGHKQIKLIVHQRRSKEQRWREHWRDEWFQFHLPTLPMSDLIQIPKKVITIEEG